MDGGNKRLLYLMRRGIDFICEKRYNRKEITNKTYAKIEKFVNKIYAK
jgi:hypothetical protein